MTAPRRTQPRGFAVWRPHRCTIELVEAIKKVLAEYRAYLPLTIRQCFYRLVVTWDYPKTETAYARLCETCNRARRARLIPFAVIRDDGALRHDSTVWAGPDEFLSVMRNMAQSFQLDRQVGQRVRLWVLCEAGGMAPMLARVANPYGVPVLTSGGFDSLTAKHDLAREIALQMESGVGAEVLHIGDLDPSGEHLFLSLAEDVSAMTETLFGAVPRFTRLAVTREQVRLFNLPTAPAKPTDRRRFEGETVQAEAFDPGTLTAILREAIEARRDDDIAANLLAQETDQRAELVAMMEGNA